MPTQYVSGPALDSLSVVIEQVLQYAVWAIVAGYVYFGWKLIFGPGGSTSGSWQKGAQDWVKEKAGDALDWHSERKEAGKKIAQAQGWSLSEYDDLEKLKKQVSKVADDKGFDKLDRSGKAAKRHEAKANARLISLRESIDGKTFKGLFTKKPKLKSDINAIFKKIGVFNNEVIKQISNFDTELRKADPDVNAKKQALLVILDAAIVAERGLQVEFTVIKDLLARELKKEPNLRWNVTNPGQP